MHPPLSSIHNPLDEIGKMAAIELFSRIDAAKRELTLPISNRMLSGTLVERGSLCTLNLTADHHLIIKGETIL